MAVVGIIYSIFYTNMRQLPHCPPNNSANRVLQNRIRPMPIDGHAGPPGSQDVLERRGAAGVGHRRRRLLFGGRWAVGTAGEGELDLLVLLGLRR